MTDERNEQESTCILAARLKNKSEIQVWKGGARQVPNVSTQEK